MELRRLNGWQRLWVVVTVLWAIGNSVSLYISFPSEALSQELWAGAMKLDVMKHYASELSTSAHSAAPRRLEELEEAAKGHTHKEFIELLPRQFPEVNFANTLSKYRERLADLSKLQVAWWGAWAGLTVIPPALVYGIGLVIAWVMAGFRKGNLG